MLILPAFRLRWKYEATEVLLQTTDTHPSLPLLWAAFSLSRLPSSLLKLLKFILSHSSAFSQADRRGDSASTYHATDLPYDSQHHHAELNRAIPKTTRTIHTQPASPLIHIYSPPLPDQMLQTRKEAIQEQPARLALPRLASKEIVASSSS